MAGARHPGPAAARPADLGHRPLQLPLRLLHAEGGLRPRLPLPRPRELLRSRRSSASRGRSSRSGSRRSASPAASRSCAATSSGWSSMLATLGVDLTLTTNGSLLAARRRRSRGRPRAASRSASTRSTTRRSGRMNDVDFPVEPRARGHRRRARRRAAGQGQLRRQARRQRRPDRRRWPSASAARATRCASSSTWTSAHTNGWRLDDVVPAAEIVAHDRRRVPARAGRAGLPRRGRAALALSRRRAARSA